MRKRVITNDREVYSKMNALNFTDEVFIRNPNRFQKIVNTINRETNNISVEKMGSGIIVKKNKPFKLDMFFNGKVK